MKRLSSGVVVLWNTAARLSLWSLFCIFFFRLLLVPKKDEGTFWLLLLLCVPDVRGEKKKRKRNLERACQISNMVSEVSQVYEGWLYSLYSICMHMKARRARKITIYFGRS